MDQGNIYRKTNKKETTLHFLSHTVQTKRQYTNFKMLNLYKTVKLKSKLSKNIFKDKGVHKYISASKI